MSVGTRPAFTPGPWQKHRTRAHCDICRRKQAMWRNDLTGAIVCDFCRETIVKATSMNAQAHDRPRCGLCANDGFPSDHDPQDCEGSYDRATTPGWRTVRLENARLALRAAAAPELYEALRTVIEYLPLDGNGTAIFDADIAAARAALAKADGR